VIVPFPVLASPPEMVQLTAAAPPEFNVAENCSMGTPEEFVVLQPVQLVSMVAVPGETENELFDELVDATPPPQPASMKSTGRPAMARARTGHRTRA